jgi:cyclophilin family peptidyl-prolyl cis-trans isomerase
MFPLKLLLLAGLGTVLTAAMASGEPAEKKNPVVVLDTSLGTIKIELYPDRAPVTVKNFLEYVNAKHYDGTIFHRVISSFMIQGGGFTPDMKQKPTRAPIKNEGGNGLKNERGTIAMARTNVPDSATAQFFINVKDNDFLNRERAQDRVGYAVFGKVIEGMDVVDKIKDVPTAGKGQFDDVPVTPVVIRSATVQK